MALQFAGLGSTVSFFGSSELSGCKSCFYTYAIRPNHAPFRGRPSSQRVKHRLAIQAIGFDLGTGTGKGTDKHAQNLSRAASSLLLYQNVLRGRPAQAFLKLLPLLQRGEARGISEAYGEFYSSLAAGNYLSWQDYLLEEVLTGKFNAFARAAAKGELPKSSPLHKAAAFDLDVLQKLAVAETTLVSWVQDVATSMPEGWAAAAAAYGPSTTPQHQAAKPTEPFDVPEDLTAPAFIKSPLTPSQRTAYRAHIGGKWKWSEALPELQYYYEAHGFGITAVNSTLKWAGVNLEAYDPPKVGRRNNRKVYTSLDDLELIRTNTHDFITDESHCVSGLVVGECLSPTLLWDWPREREERQEPQHGIRFVRLLASDVSQLHDVAHTLQQYPRVKFVVYCDSLTAGWGSGAHSVLHSVLAGVDWPTNAVFYASCRDKKQESFIVEDGAAADGQADDVPLSDCFELA